jgi:MATE family multidrug resistance protein
VSVIGGILLLFLVFLAEPIFNFIGHAENVRKLEVEYFISICFSALPTAIVAATSAFFTGLGNTKVIMKINSVGLIANVILAYPMIFGKWGCPALGIAGAGYATALASLAGAVYGLYLVFNQSNEMQYRVRSGWKLNTELMMRFVRYGFPSGLQWALEGLAFTVFLIVVGRMPNGSAALASSGIVVTVMMLAILPALGIAQAVLVLVGQHLGEKNPAQAELSTWSGLQVAAMYILCVGFTFAIFPGFYLSWFHNPSDPQLWDQVSVIVPYLLLYVALFTSFDSMNLIFSFALKGAGDTQFVTFVALLMPWPLMVFPTWLFKDFNGAIYWAWGAASVYIICQAFVFWNRFVGGKWKAMSVIN